MRGFLSYNGGGEHKMQTNRKVFFHIRGSAQCSRMWSVGNLQRACAETDSFEGGQIQHKFSTIALTTRKELGKKLHLHF